MDYVNSKDSAHDIADILGRIRKETLVDFLVEYAGHDSKFVNALNVRFRKPEFEDELNKIDDEINHALEGVSDYRTHDSWGYVSFDVGDIRAEIMKRAEQGHIRLAFAETELLYRRMLENFEYQGECEISDEAEICLDIMSDIADKAISEEDKGYIFKKCIELSELDDGKDYGADYEDKLLGISAKFVTSENRRELEDSLSRFDSNCWREEKFIMIRLEIIRKIDGEDAADTFVNNNIRFPKVREIAFDKVMRSHNFEDAERLCLEALSDDALSNKNHHHGMSPWLYRLYSVHETADNADKMTESAQEILLSGDIEYYDKVKSLLIAQSAWEKSYPELLIQCKLKLHSSQYMKILAKENEYALLLEEVKNHTEQIYQYGKLLSKKHLNPVRDVFVEQINKEAERANGRETYRIVCSRISRFAEAGYNAEAIAMINEFRIKFKRKPAFVDELNKICKR
jgi:hypothetical protein